MATRAFLWVLCAVIGLWGAFSYVRLSFNLWIRALRSQPAPVQIRSYLLRTGIAVTAVFAAGYGALLVYSAAYLEWLGAFLVLTVVVVAGSVANLWWRIHLRTTSLKRESQDDNDGWSRP